MPPWPSSRSSPGPRAGSARRRRAGSPASPSARLVLVARREDRLEQLADELGGATRDRRRSDRPRRAGAGARDGASASTASCTCWSTTPAPPGAARFADAGWANVERHMKLDFEAPVRLTEALLPLLRETARRRGVAGAGLDRQRRQHRRPGLAPGRRAPTRRPSSRSPAGATRCTPRSASTASTSAWCSPASSRPRASRPPSCSHARTRWIVSSPEVVAEAIIDAGPGGRAERYVPALLLDRRRAADPGPAARPPRDRRRRRSPPPPGRATDLVPRRTE